MWIKFIGNTWYSVKFLIDNILRFLHLKLWFPAILLAHSNFKPLNFSVWSFKLHFKLWLLSPQIVTQSSSYSIHAKVWIVVPQTPQWTWSLFWSFFWGSKEVFIYSNIYFEPPLLSFEPSKSIWNIEFWAFKLADKLWVFGAQSQHKTLSFWLLNHFKLFTIEEQQLFATKYMNNHFKSLKVCINL